MKNQFFFTNQPTVRSAPFGDSVFDDAGEAKKRATAKSKELTVPPRILLIDDDPSFLKIMKRAAESRDISLTCCQSLDQFGALKNWDYDVIIMDYDLGAVTGFELTTYLQEFTKEAVPVVLVSQTKRNDPKDWPNTIREFVHKSQGPFAVLEASIEAHDAVRTHKNLMREVGRN